MSTRPASFSALLALFFLLAPASLPAQGISPDQFDILGVKLGMPGGPELKKQIEALPDGFKCGEARNNIMSCKGPLSPVPNPRGSTDNNLYIEFDEVSHKVWKINRSVGQGAGPTPENMLETLYKKYGQPPPSEVEFKKESNAYTIYWAFDRNGNVVTKKGNKDITDPFSTDNPCHQFSLNELCGVSLRASFFSARDGVYAYYLTLADTREQYDRKVKREREEEERKQKARSTPPSF